MNRSIKKIIGILICISVIFLSFKITRELNNRSLIKDNRLGRFIMHDDFTNLVIDMENSDDVPVKQALEAAASKAARSGADVISLCVSLGELVYYYPAFQGETLVNGEALLTKNLNKLVSAGIDPYGTVLSEIRRHNIPVLAKFRVNDRHHVAGHPFLASRFWKEHPEWYIGHTERGTDMMPYFKDHPSVGARALPNIEGDRPLLLDYAVPEVREKRLAIFREVIERYDVAGATLHFLREPYCVSFPEKNAGYLTDYVRQCRKILDEVLGEKGIETPVLGALIPWDINFCRAMGIEVDVWISEGLLDYVSPSEGWVTDFNMDIQPWIDLTKDSRCGVYPGIVGLIAYRADYCLPENYENEGKRENSAKIMPEHVRALAHRFYYEGAKGLSSFNFYSVDYSHLFPLSDLVNPDNLDAGLRKYIYMKEKNYIGYDFLQLRLPADGSLKSSIRCLMHEELNGTEAHLRFIARGIDDADDLNVIINGREISFQSLETLPHEGSGFLYLQYPLKQDDLRDGDNEISFSLSGPAKKEVIIQEIEIQVNPPFAGK